MGCNCSEPNKADYELSNEAESKGKPEKRTPSSLADSDEQRSHDQSTDDSTSKTWHFDAQDQNEGNILETISELIGEEYKDDIETAISTVKVKEDINAVVRHLLHKVSLDVFDTDEKSKHECKEGIETCSAFVRISKVFEIYIEWLKESKKSKSLYELVMEKLAQQSINDKQILDDYHHLMVNHNNDKDFEIIYGKLVSNNLVISIDKSDIILRNYRDRGAMNEKQRTKLYFGFTESKEVIFIKLLDRIYCFYVYSFDIGMRLKMTEKLKILYAKGDEEKEEKERDDSDEEGINGNGYGKKDEKLVSMSAILDKKQINLMNVLGENRINTNRFCTNNVNVNVSQEGVIFLYKESEKKDENMVNEGKEYEENEWFIRPKFKDLKEELMNNGKSNVDKSEFDDLEMLSVLEAKSDYNVSLRQTMNDVESWGLKEEHVMALMVYCNFASVQYELKQTYFRLNLEETNEDFKTRHSVFGNLGGLLKEILYEYGTECTQKSRVNIFYHSINITQISGTLIKFRAPISTSTSKIVLFNYSSVNGTIIEFNPGQLNLDEPDFKPKYFDCSLISDFANEDEKLFVQQRDSMLELTSIINIKTFESYQLQVMALNIICTAFGDVNEGWADDKKNPFTAIPKKQRLKELVKKVLERRGVEVQAHLFGKKKKKKINKDEKVILLQLLKQFSISKREMILFWFSEQSIPAMWPWMNELLEFMRDSCFCKDLQNGNKWVKLDLLSLFFENLESVTIVDCEITEKILIDIDLFIQKLQMDPKQKAKKEKTPPPEPQEPDEVDRLMGIDLDKIVEDLHSSKPHVSFKDPDFDDLCDYRQCKIKEIKIFESFSDDGNKESFVDDKVRKKYNRKFRKCGWQMVKDKIWKGKEGFVFRKMS